MREELYEHYLSACGMSSDQREILGEMISNAFPFERGCGILAGWSASINSILRFVSGEMQYHDEFEQVPVLMHDNALQQTVSHLLVGYPLDEKIRVQMDRQLFCLANNIRSLLSQEQTGALLAAMNNLARARLDDFLALHKENGVEAYELGSAVCWLSFLGHLRMAGRR